MLGRVFPGSRDLLATLAEGPESSERQCQLRHHDSGIFQIQVSADADSQYPSGDVALNISLFIKRKIFKVFT
jgi:hypothetical protein